MAEKETKALTLASASKAEVTPGYDSASGFELLQRGAQALSASSMVPEKYAGNVANCIVALEMALRMRVSPLMVMQNLNVIRGKPSWSSVFLIGALNGSPHYTAVKFSLSGEKGKDSRTCVATTTEKETGELIEGPEVTIKMAKDDGWWGRKDSKWPRMSELMLRYRAGAWLVRTVAPELTMGFPGEDEVMDSSIMPMPTDVVVEPGAPQQVTAAEEDPKPKPRRARRTPKAAEKAQEQPAATAMEQTKAPAAAAAPAAPEPVQEATQPAEQEKKFSSPF